MKNKILNIFTILSLLFVSCDDDSDTVNSEPLLGIYTISKSVLTSDATSQNGLVSIPSGTDITGAIVTAFLSEIQCNSSANKAIEVAENNKIYFVCRLEDKTPQDQGSWAINEARTEFTMTLLIQGNLVPLKLVSLQESSSRIAGNVASIPVPPALLASVNSQFAGVTDQAVLISIDIELERLN